MSDITQCPECSTRFKVNEAQLEVHDGLVRCGRCLHVFNARETLVEAEPSPQLSLPIESEPAPDREDQPNPAVTQAETVTPAPETAESDQPAPSAPDSDAIPPMLDVEDELLARAQQADLDTSHAEAPLPAPRRGRLWLGVLAALLLVLALVAQAAFFYRVELAARLPGLKPVLTQYCAALGCTVELPQEAELLSIESSDLKSDPAQSNLVTLQALLHNRAPYAQAFPSLELTLTDMQDRPVARRLFHPGDYLKKETPVQAGLAANRELEIALHIDTSDLNPAGYRLFLFYPR